MTLDELFLSESKRDLCNLVGGTTLTFPQANLPLDRYIALSLLQKAIRRGELVYGLISASYLFRADPTAFWRRLAIIAVEDIGIANIPLVCQVLIAAGGKKIRQEIGDSEQIAVSLIGEMCRSPKDRSTDDLFDVLNRDTSLDALKATVAEIPEEEVWDFYNPHTQGIEENAVALVQLATSWTNFSAYVGRQTRWPLVISMLPEEHVSPCIKETANLGLLRTRLILAPLLAAISPDAPKVRSFIDDDLLPECHIHGLPSWAFGMHTRTGLAAFRSFAHRSTEMKSLMAQRVPSSVSKSKAIGGLVFRLDCGQLQNRLDWDAGHRLKERTTAMGWGFPDDLVPDALRILSKEVDLLNDCRVQAFELSLR